MVTSRSGLTSAVLKISPTASPGGNGKQLPGSIPSACQQLVTYAQSQCWPQAARELRSAGTWLAFPSREPEAAAGTWGASGGEESPVSVPGPADAEEEHRVPGTVSSSIQTALCAPLGCPCWRASSQSAVLVKETLLLRNARCLFFAQHPYKGLL